MVWVVVCGRDEDGRSRREGHFFGAASESVDPCPDGVFQPPTYKETESERAMFNSSSAFLRWSRGQFRRKGGSEVLVVPLKFGTAELKRAFSCSLALVRAVFTC